MARGAVGLGAGVLVLFGVFVTLLGGNWQLGFRHDWVLTLIFVDLVPAALGILSPVWYWIGRPLWYHLGRPGGRRFEHWQSARFLPGILGPLVGIALLFPVSATSRFWIQILVPFGLMVGVGSPLWFWFLRPLASAWDRGPRIPLTNRVTAGLPAGVLDRLSRTPGSRVVAIGLALLLLSAAVTVVIALPVNAPGESVRSNGLTVSVTDIRTTDSLTTADGETTSADDTWGFLLVRIAVENRGASSRSLPGTGIGSIAVIAPACEAMTFGEPRNNCNSAYVGQNFTAGGETYRTYEEEVVATDGTIEPGQRVAGWLAYRIESAPSADPAFEAMIVVDDIGRWTLGDDWRASAEPQG